MTSVIMIGPLNAANFESGNATDGQVLTADGAGGAAFEDAAGGGGSMPGEWNVARSLWSVAQDGGSPGDYVLFNVSGTVLIKNIIAIVRESLSAGGHGVSIPGQPVGSILASQGWDEGGGVLGSIIDLGGASGAIINTFPQYFSPPVAIIVEDISIVLNVTESTATGSIEVFCCWLPLSDAASVI